MFAERLKELRKDRGFTNQTSIAKDLGISQQTYSQWESGKREPSKSTLEKLADFFNVSTDYLLGKTNNKDIRKNELEQAEFLFRTTVSELKLNEKEKTQLKKDIENFIEQRKKVFKEK
ncbi:MULTISPECIES: helix-turn-helix domain-containing protein [Streptococcus]|uniref:ICESt1 APR2 Cro/CI family transcriptional regulator n=1 Tax=Streptococcus agalactiae TaxID=1311 RepID=A0AB74H2C6_STRAG|nr:helix-turn-helix transcriptional regulator [Streptococcus agalactiae]EPU19403.1 XRE family transcriptional regulator [Streptococcus agalactiae LMG 14608]EPV86418.1 XRE family transcriptional regulator [Streptococcus agalactiae FSL S3-586]KLL28013.1 Cro/Cl family transcriptional regulator [Streptococcus agalactiae]MBE3601296.1 helix-turn-helix transcriptional regulator [Streptococcus agalactiae]MDK6300205.1 helix-turn-helix transcriptional regulator [Streptococcus agalactiae]